MDLTEFLAARLDEDEAAAKRTPEWRVERWTAARYKTSESGREWRVDAEPPASARCIIDQVAGGDAAHIARHDPARVLREVEAKRAILARYSSLPSVTNLGEHLQRSQEQAGLGFAIRLLAAIWDDHPDYRPEWKP